MAKAKKKTAKRKGRTRIVSGRVRITPRGSIVPLDPVLQRDLMRYGASTAGSSLGLQFAVTIDDRCVGPPPPPPDLLCPTCGDERAITLGTIRK